MTAEEPARLTPRRAWLFARGRRTVVAMDGMIDYQERVLEALRGLVAELLAEVAEEGFPGEHYFYLAFRTRHPGVQIPAWMRDRYPDELNIVLQRQFWDLEVEEEAFSVTLSFNGVRHRLTIPYAALTAFLDPVASFGLRFDRAAVTPAPPAVEAPAAAGPERVGGEVVRFDPTRRK